MSGGMRWPQKKFYHTTGPGTTLVSGGRRRLRFCVQHALKFFFITFAFPTNNRGISDTAAANWQAQQRSKAFLQLRGSLVDLSPQVRPALCAVNCVTLMNLLNQDQKNVCPILASAKSTKSEAIFHESLTIPLRKLVFLPLFLHFEKLSRAHLLKHYNGADSLSLVSLPNSLPGYQMLACNKN